MPRVWIIIFILIAHSVRLHAQNIGNACHKNKSIRVVVLGSSTAAGSGPIYSDSTWVNRYRTHLKQLNTQNEVINLAIGGTTTYHIMPDWYTAPSGRPAANTTNNISEALRLNADAIIINMPSNDAANGFVASEQLFNFQTMHNTADSANISVLAP